MIVVAAFLILQPFAEASASSSEIASLRCAQKPAGGEPSHSGLTTARGKHFTIVEDFNARKQGNQPTAGLAIDSAGTLYGATELGGGPEDFGALFAIPAGGTEKVLYAFGPNLVEPNTTPAFDSAGNLYGTALYDASGTGDEWGGIYKVDNAGNETVLYDFTGKSDGGTSNSNLLIDGSGNLYGTTAYGGNL